MVFVRAHNDARLARLIFAKRRARAARAHCRAAAFGGARARARDCQRIVAFAGHAAACLPARSVGLLTLRALFCRHAADVCWCVRATRGLCALGRTRSAVSAKGGLLAYAALRCMARDIAARAVIAYRSARGVPL